MNIKQIAMGCKPDPYKFTIKSIEHVNGNTIVVANYGGATFNGDKLMVLRGVHEDFETLDPHFLSEDYPVIARFIPTEEGLNWARLVARNATMKTDETSSTTSKRINTAFLLEARQITEHWTEEQKGWCMPHISPLNNGGEFPLDFFADGAENLDPENQKSTGDS